jgi:hypothetical protein
MTETQKERLQHLAKENGLNKDHFFKSTARVRDNNPTRN